MGSAEMTHHAIRADVEPWSPGDTTTDNSPTNAAFYLAIAHVWLTEGMEHRCLPSDTAGFERFRNYVLGYRDGVPKTPHWAAVMTGVPSYTIKAMARYWAATDTAAAFPFGCREDLEQLVSEVELLHADLGPRTIAIRGGLPKTFVGGIIYDYEADEVIEGAAVTIRWSGGYSGVEDIRDTQLTVTTDELGGFLVDALEGDTFHITVAKEGYITNEVGPVAAEHDLQDIPMFLEPQGPIW